MRVSPVFNISLLQLIKRNSGLTIEEIQKHFPTSSLSTIKNDLDILLGMREVELTEDGKYI